MILDDIVSYLKKTNFSLDKFSDDGRINSAVNEPKIIEILMSKFENIKPAKKREWFDFCYENNKDFIPINLKITELSTDNLNCKLGIYYALTGKIPNFTNEVIWEKFLVNLSENLQENNKDYYFLIINKNDLNDIFWTSLKQISQLTPNGNNLPFQANWAKNKQRENRNFIEAKKFILTTMGKSFKLRANVYTQFLDIFPEFKGQI